jgi:hypothetical protein
VRHALVLAAALVLPVSIPAAEGPGGAAGTALQAIFPGMDRVESSDLLLTDEMARRLDDLSRSRIPERMVTFYVARREADVLGYAVIQSHVVRTKRETLLVAFEPDGSLRRIVVLAFLEPPEYKPSERWLAQLAGKGTADRLAVGDDVAPITGSTLSARGVTEHARWLLQALKAGRDSRKVP